MRESGESVAVSAGVLGAGTRFARDPLSELSAKLDAARDPVLAHLRSAFPRSTDLEDAYQEACVEVLEMAARGEPIRDVQALLRTIAWRSARASRRRKRADSLDARVGGVDVVVDDALAPDEVAELRIDGDALRLIVESLDDRQAAVIKLRFDRELTGPEIQRELGITAKRLEKTIAAAYERIAEELTPDGAEGETHWQRRQRSLLLACLVGIASGRQRRRAADMLQRDPSCRAMYAQMRAAFEDVAAVLPLPIVAERCDRAGVLGRLDELWLSIRHVAETVTGRAASSGAIEPASVGGATLGAGAVVKVAAACLAVSGAAAVCIGIDGKPPKAQPQAEVEVRRPKPTQRKQLDARRVVRAATPKAKAAKRKRSTDSTPAKATNASQPQVPVSSPASTAPASPAPKGSSEFGPGAVGSTPPTQQPAASPQDGGGEFTP